MKPILFLSAICCAITGLLACEHTGDGTGRTGQRPKTFSKAAFRYPLKKLEGTYSGDFGGAPIRIVLRHISPMHAIGYNLHYGLRRNISGSVEAIDKGIQLILSEPGDNEYDGVFSFCIDTTTFNATGDWKPKEKSGTSDKRFVLKRDWSDTVSLMIADQIAYWEEGSDRISFGKDGLCVYSYYPAGKLQMEELHGNWEKDRDNYVVYWQKNTIFPERRTTFIYNQDSMMIVAGSHRFQSREFFP